MGNGGVYHGAVKNALIKDGWTITADPYPIKYEEIKLFADLAGEKTIFVTREGLQIVVEIKSFNSLSLMREFETALGQYLIYQTFLSITHPNYRIYWAINNQIYDKFFQKTAIQLILHKYQVVLLVINMTQEEIIEWTS